MGRGRRRELEPWEILSDDMRGERKFVGITSGGGLNHDEQQQYKVGLSKIINTSDTLASMHVLCELASRGRTRCQVVPIRCIWNTLNCQIWLTKRGTSTLDVDADTAMHLLTITRGDQIAHTTSADYRAHVMTQSHVGRAPSPYPPKHITYTVLVFIAEITHSKRIICSTKTIPHTNPTTGPWTLEHQRPTYPNAHPIRRQNPS